MDARAALQGVQSALGDELAKHWGRIGSIEAEVSRSVGYLRKVCRGNRSIPLDLLLESLQALDVDPATFFAKALGVRIDPDGFLRELELPGKETPAVTKIEKATSKMEAAPAEAPANSASRSGRAAHLVAKMAACTVKEQRRRLRTAQRYRTREFVDAYLAHLDALRYDDPKKVAKLGETVAIDLVPAVPGTLSERLALQCRAIVLFSAAHRLLGGFPTAVRAARFALEVSRKHSLEDVTAKTLQRSAYLLADHGQFRQALILLREAFEIQFDLGSQVEMGRVMTDRSFMLMSLGDYRASVRASQRALELLPGICPELRQCYLATYQSLAYGCEQMGDLESAEKWLTEAIGVFENEGVINRAKLIWHQGRIAHARGDYSAAEARLQLAHRLLDERAAAADGTMLALDLTRALLAQGKAREAYELARRMAAYLVHFRKHKVAEAALAEYTRMALEGKLTLSLIDRIQPQLAVGRGPGRGRQSLAAAP